MPANWGLIRGAPAPPLNPTISDSSQKKLNATPRRSPGLIAAVLGYAIWCALVLWMVGDALRNNDQAAYLNGALQLNRAEISPWHATLFNYDKQFFSYWLIAALLRIPGRWSIVLLSNLAQAAGLCVSFGALMLFKFRHIPVALVLPFALCPVLVISAPFVATGLISLLFLLLGFAVIDRRSQLRLGLACLLIGIAAACRADVILAIPTLIFTQLSRRKLRRVITSPLIMGVIASSLLPPLFGRYFIGAPTVIFQALAFPHPNVILAFIVFGVGIMVLAVLGASSAYFVDMAQKKSLFRNFYLIRAISPILPLAFYLIQLRTPQHFLLTLACYVFVISDRRARLVFWWLRREFYWSRWISAGVVLSVMLPWLVGVKAPSLPGLQLTVGLPDAFPTSHGHFPMGAFAQYSFYDRNHGYVLDHNQKIFLAAERVRYESCNGRVILLRTPMYNYLELAARLKNLSVEIAETGSDLPCSYIYSDARSLLRGDVDRAGHLLRFASLAASYDGQAVLRIGTALTDLGLALEALRDHFLGREFEFYVLRPNSKIILHRAENGGAIYALSRGKCSIASSSLEPVDVRVMDGQHFYLWTVTRDHASRIVDMMCPAGAQAGQITFTLPSWMGK